MSFLKKTSTKTSEFLIKSIQEISELTVLEIINEGVAEIKQKKTSLVTFRRIRGLLRFSPCKSLDNTFLAINLSALIIVSIFRS